MRHSDRGLLEGGPKALLGALAFGEIGCAAADRIRVAARIAQLSLPQFLLEPTVLHPQAPCFQCGRDGERKARQIILGDAFSGAKPPDFGGIFPVHVSGHENEGDVETATLRDFERPQATECRQISVGQDYVRGIVQCRLIIRLRLHARPGNDVSGRFKRIGDERRVIGIVLDDQHPSCFHVVLHAAPSTHKDGRCPTTCQRVR